MSESSVEGTLTEQSRRQLGRGLPIADGAQATLEATYISGNRDTGVFVQHGAPGRVDLTMRGSLVQDTLPAVLLFDESGGVVARTVVEGNRFGAVFQGTRQPVVGDQCVIRGNTEQNWSVDQSLPIPDDLPTIP